MSVYRLSATASVARRKGVLESMFFDKVTKLFVARRKGVLEKQG